MKKINRTHIFTFVFILLLLVLLYVLYYYYNSFNDIVTPIIQTDNCGCQSTTFGCCPDSKTVRNYDGSSCIQPLNGFNNEISEINEIESFDNMAENALKDLKKCFNNCIKNSVDYDYNGGGNQNGIYHGGNGINKHHNGHHGGNGGGSDDGNYDWLNQDNVPVYDPEDPDYWKPYNQPGACMGTQYGCCWDGSASNKDGSNCPTPKGNCRRSNYGCCPDGVMGKNNPNGSNCKPFTPNPKSSVKCARTNYGCCPDGKEARKRRVIYSKNNPKKIVRAVYGENCYGIFV